MKRTIMLIGVIIGSLFMACDENVKPYDPSFPTETGALKMTVHAGMVGTLQKTAAIELTKLYVVLSASGLSLIYDTLTLTGGSSERTERKTYTGLVSRINDQVVNWTLAVETRDQNGRVIHSSDTTFSIPPLDTANIELFLAAQYSMLEANYLPIRDSVNRCELLVDGEIQGNLSFEKQSRLGDTVTLNYDYLQASPTGVAHTIKMNAYGQLWGIDTLLYTGDATISVFSGQSTTYQVVLKYVGPDTLHGAATMIVSLGAIGKVTLNGILSREDFGNVSNVNAWRYAEWNYLPWDYYGLLLDTLDGEHFKEIPGAIVEGKGDRYRGGVSIFTKKASLVEGHRVILTWQGSGGGTFSNVLATLFDTPEGTTAPDQIYLTYLSFNNSYNGSVVVSSDAVYTTELVFQSGVCTGTTVNSANQVVQTWTTGYNSAVQYHIGMRLGDNYNFETSYLRLIGVSIL